MSFDMEAITGSILLLCVISLANANSSPTITHVLYEVCEDTPVGTVAFIIQASDPDGDSMTFTLTNGNKEFFTVNRNTGAVTVARELNREQFPLMSLGVDVSDGLNDIQGTLTLIIGDANDNTPTFVKSSYDKDVPENTAIGTTLFTVQANDGDTSSAAAVTYKIDEVTPAEGAGLFAISATTGHVTLIQSLNYTSLSSFYRLKINATDGGGKCYFAETKYLSSSVYSFINVVDVPDLDPRFIGLPYIGSVKENAAVDLSVLKVIALDQDTGVNDRVAYSIQNSSASGLFKIRPDDGTILVSSAIDREAVGDTVTLTVKATESQSNIHGIFASTTADVQIHIQDINDNRPEFYRCETGCVSASQFTGEVLEHSLGSVSFNMTVKDADKASRIRLTLEGTDKDVFSVEPSSVMSESTVELLVKQPQALDFEQKQQMVLQVIATDEEEATFRSTATVTINIRDANDNSPTFPQPTYKLDVPEQSPANTALETITAVDPDTMDQGKLKYKLLPDSILPYFDVNPNTGVVYVKNGSLLDREVRSAYSATLQVTDTDGKPGTTVLEITVTDINDNPPVFNRESYLEFVQEGQQLEVKIEATDVDEPNTVNSQIVYGIAPSNYSDNFTIDASTGVLRSSGELDRESLDPDLNGRIQINVTATDQGSPQLSATVPVIINIDDINDNTPYFEPPSYTFHVKEGEIGAFVGSVYAEDSDQTMDFNRISFSIIDGSFGSFIIRTFPSGRGYMGNITVDPDIELNYESARTQYNLKVEATDLGQRTAVVAVEVLVEDVNDERPEFTPVAPVTVKENTTISEGIGNFTAIDKDGNHSLVYELKSIKCKCNDVLEPCNWFILDPSGEVRVNPEDKIDYEQCTQGVVEAQVVDMYTEKGENYSVSTGEMVINIEDINDNAPEFLPSDAVFVVVSESANKGTSVAGVTATDRDTGENKQIEFKVTGVQFHHTNNQTTNMRTLFEAVTTQQNDIYVGIIQTNEGLDMTLKGKYLVTVTATDKGGLSSNIVLDIFTVDLTYKVELQFSSTEAEVEQDLDNIIRALTSATKASVEVVAIRSKSDAQASRDSQITILEVYFVYPNGTALTYSEVERMLSHPDHYPELINLGLKYIGNSPVDEPEDDVLKYILLGALGGLIIVLIILTTSLMCTRRTFKRKLKAAQAMKSATMMNTESQNVGAVVPGTNKYTMEGANPVLNLNIDTAVIYEDSDVDKMSLNSLDYNYDVVAPGMNTKRIPGGTSRTPKYIDPLDEALDQNYPKKNSINTPDVGFNNPSFKNTDL
ncbi:cadherin-related family member 2 [Mugil cephalus]|uniref:cadherin-related family member 2 n=1 Tax=Mugil cephalus TaxID=48193 RepID=UPI001FB74ADF|nr:cadherin-related family member 2 [Mugil cephalus]